MFGAVTLPLFPNLGLVGEFSQTVLDDLRVFGLAWEIMRWDFPRLFPTWINWF